jgi:2-polyprenylphenol 6-hydroxylase
MEDLIILGAGAVGLSLALALAPSGRKILVLDRQLPTPKQSSNNRVYALSPQSQAFLSRLGAFSLCTPSAAYQAMHVWDDTAAIHFSCRDIGVAHLGHIVAHPVLIQALLTRLADFSNVRLQVIQACQAVSQQDSVQLTVDDRVYHTRCLAGADGASSWLRQNLQIPAITWSYQQTALVATLKLDTPHQQTAWQRFLPTGPLALLPLADAHQVALVWSCETDAAVRLMAASDAEFNDSISTAIAQHLGKAKLISPRHQFPLVMQHARHYTRGNIALLGDAIHTLHPLAGQGLNLGLADAALLSELLVSAEPSPRLLRRYERERKSANWQLIALMEAFNRLFSNDHPTLRTLRQAGLNVCEQSSWLKRKIIAYVS